MTAAIWESIQYSHALTMETAEATISFTKGGTFPRCIVARERSQLAFMYSG